MEYNIIPDEIFIDILKYLSYNDVIQILNTCKYNNNLCKDDDVWKSLCLNNFMLKDRIIHNTWYKNYLYIKNIFPSAYFNIIYKHIMTISKYLDEVLCIIDIAKYIVSSSKTERTIDKIGIYINENYHISTIFGTNTECNEIYVLHNNDGKVSTYGTIGCGSKTPDSLCDNDFHVECGYTYILLDKAKIEFLKAYYQNKIDSD